MAPETPDQRQQKRAQALNGLRPVSSTSAGQLWCNRGLHLEITNSSGSHEVWISKPFARIGSLPGSEVVLDEGDFRRRQLMLIGLANGIYCIDFVASQKNGKQTGYWVKSDTPIRIGATKIKVSALTPRGRRESVEPPDSNKWRSALELNPSRVHVISRGRTVARFLLRKQLTCFGRLPGNRIQIQNDYLSQFHLLLVRDEKGVWLIDLLSANKPVVNGHRQDASPVRGSVSRILVGSLELRLTIPQDAEHADPKQPVEPDFLDEECESALPGGVAVSGASQNSARGIDPVATESAGGEERHVGFPRKVNGRFLASIVSDSSELVFLKQRLMETESALAAERKLIDECRESLASQAAQESLVLARISDCESRLAAKDDEVRRLMSAFVSSQLQLETGRQERQEMLARLESLRDEKEALAIAGQDETRIRVERELELDKLIADFKSREKEFETRLQNLQAELAEKSRLLEHRCLDSDDMVKRERIRCDFLQSRIADLEQELAASAEAYRFSLQETASIPETFSENVTLEPDSALNAIRLSELAEKEQELRKLSSEIELANERLARARQAFERELATDSSQMRVLLNLDRERREKSWWYRLLHRRRNES